MLKIVSLVLFLVLFGTASQNLKDTLLEERRAPTLRRVVVLARHGSKVPYAPVILDACPAFKQTQEDFFEKLQVLADEVTPGGAQQLFSAGQFARQRYIDNLGVLPKSFYLNSSFSFQSQRSAFCLQSTEAFCMGMFPDGTGPAGFLKTNPQLVPISVPYGQPGTDVLFNCRDGPCASEWSAGKAQYATPARLAKFKEKHATTLAEISAACGAKAGWATRSDVLDNVKQVDDAMTWARESGLSGDLNGRMSQSTRIRFDRIAFDTVKEIYVGHGEQLAVTACGFPAKLLSLFSTPSEHVQFDFFLNHREMLYGTLSAFFFEQTFQIPNHVSGFVMTGSTIFFELHEDNQGKFVKIYLFTPESSGFVVQLFPKGCDATRCSLQTMKDNFAQFMLMNGDIQDMCAKPQGAFTTDLIAPSTTYVFSFALLASVGVVVLSRMQIFRKRRGLANAQPLLDGID